tara:strand:- start:4915 stop:5478 length:564 start_codon:yes stop_codon:yes gene_type:complete
MPVVIDVETGGFNPKTDALLEVAYIFLKYKDNILTFDEIIHDHIAPFKGAHLDPEALKFNKIEPFHPFRGARDEKNALEDAFSVVRQKLKDYRCSRAVLVGHNPAFDLSFLVEASDRNKVKLPFHKFTTFDTATLAGVAYGQTVLAKAVKAANIEFDDNEAHGALYDATKTAELFCTIVNTWERFKK